MHHLGIARHDCHKTEKNKKHTKTQLLQRMHSRTWDRASAVFKWSGTLASCQIWSLAEFQLAGAEVPGAQLEVGQVVFRGKLGIEVAQGYFCNVVTLDASMVEHQWINCRRSTSVRV